MTLVVDTSVIFAAMDGDDPDHQACKALLSTQRTTPIIPAPVLVELEYWCAKRLGPAAFPSLLEDTLTGALKIEELSRRDYQRIRELLVKHPTLGLVDASVVSIAERYREDSVATLDHRDFATIRPNHTKAFKLLP